MEFCYCDRGFVKFGGWGCFICLNGRRCIVWILGLVGLVYSWSLGGWVGGVMVGEFFEF